MLVADLDYSDYIGRLAVGRIFNGNVSSQDSLVCINENNEHVMLRVTKLQGYQGIALREIESAEPGDIVVISGIENVKIGDTICTVNNPAGLKTHNSGCAYGFDEDNSQQFTSCRPGRASCPVDTHP